MHKINIVIRAYQETDVPALANIFYHTIHTIHRRDYTEEQVNAWAPHDSAENYSGWQKKLAKVKPYVAVVNETIVGFAEFETSGHIDCFYVHHEWQSKGIGSALMKAIIQKAEKQSISRIFAEVSITAKPFFEHKGFRVVKEQTVTLRGAELKNFVMEKYFTRLAPCTTNAEWEAAKTYRQTYFFDKQPVADPYTWTFDHPDHRHFVLYQDANIIGYAHIQLWPEHRVAIRIIVIEETKRNQTFGKQFLYKIEEWLRRKKYRSTHAESSPAALNFYTQCGYARMPFDDPDGYEGGVEDIPVGKML